MKRALPTLLLAATSFLLLTAGGCEPKGPETFNQDDGTHEMFKARTSDYPFDRKMTFRSKWASCRWYVDVQDPGGKRRTIQHGTETKLIYVPFIDGRRGWVVQESCGKVEVHNR